MCRWMMIVLLAFGLVCSTTLLSQVRPAYAFAGIDNGGDTGTAKTGDDTGGAKTGGDTGTGGTTTTGGDTTTTGGTTGGDTGGATTTGGDTGGANSGDTTPPAETTPPPPPKPMKADIRALLDAGKSKEAEAAYLDWATYWREDDLSLVRILEHAVLLQQYRDGKFVALVGMAKTGDSEAREILRTVVLSGGNELPPADFAEAIRILGESRDPATLNTLRLLLFHENPQVVLAAIDALGTLGDVRVINELMNLYDDTDLNRDVQLSLALLKLGATKQVRARFVPQLKFPQPGAKERAALILGAAGSPDGWTTVRQMLVTKDATYYPLVLRILPSLPSVEGKAFILRALNGSEAEQLAALQSSMIVPLAELDRTLLVMLRDTTRTLPVRAACVQLLAQHRAKIAEKELRSMAAALDGVDPLMKASAMTALPNYPIIKDLAVREMIRQRFSSDDEGVARAARIALLSYAMKPLLLAQQAETTKKKK